MAAPASSLGNASQSDAAKSRVKKIPVVSDVIAWAYRLVKLPTRFHELNDLFWKLFARTDRVENHLKETVVNLENLKGQMAFLARDLEMFHHTLKEKAGVSASETVKAIANQDFSSETYLYFAFENKFRGAQEEIRKVQLQYAERIKTAKDGSKGETVLDIGCGRGEFIKLMREHGIPARGVDATRAMIDACKEQDLNAELKDALECLRTVKDNSLIGVTAFQMVEHVPPQYLIEMIKASFGKIAPGGIIILETVNPGSLSSFKNFYLDLTHHNPIPSETLKFLVESAGFKRVEVHYSSFIPDHLKLQGADDNIRKLNDLLFGPQDYAIIGWR